MDNIWLQKCEKGKLSVKMVSHKPKTLASSTGSGHFQGVEEKLNELLDVDGGISNQKVDIRRANNTEIMLTKIKMPLPDLMSRGVATRKRGVRRKFEEERSDGCAFKRKRGAQLHPFSFEKSIRAVSPICSKVGDGMDMS